MQALEVRLTGMFQSFRLPLAYKYQRTLRFPPPTTLFGMIGSCLGWDAVRTHCELPKHMRLACVGRKRPINRDLMSYRDVKKKDGKTVHADVVEREFLPFVELSLYIAADSEWLERVEYAFMEPVGALVLGRADELIAAHPVGRREMISVSAATPPDATVHVLPGLYLGNIRGCLRFDVESLGRYETPEAFSLPNGFEYLDSKGTRRTDVREFREFTQLTSRWPVRPEALTEEWGIDDRERLALQFVTVDGTDSR